MKRILTLLLVLATGWSAMAQYGPRYAPARRGPASWSNLELGFSLNNFTGELRPGEGAGHTQRPDRFGFFGEYRVDMTEFMDIGLQLFTTMGRGTVYGGSGYGITHDDWFWQGAALLVVDYNVFPFSSLCPYLGIGVGPGMGYDRNKTEDVSGWTHALVISPRAGVELFDHLRLAVQYQAYLNGAQHFSNIGLCLSWSFDPALSFRRSPRGPATGHGRRQRW